MSRWSFPRRPRAQVAQETPMPVPDPDQAWRLLNLVNEWIRHSDAKAGVTLAFAGVLGTMLFNLVNGFAKRTILFDVLVVVAVFLLVLTASLCAWTLTPGVKDADAEPEAISRRFFGSIARNFKGTRHQYRDALATLTIDPHELTKTLPTRSTRTRRSPQSRRSPSSGQFERRWQPAPPLRRSQQSSASQTPRNGHGRQLQAL